MGKTFKHQSELPSLPIPELNETKSKLLEWVKPIVSAEQFQETMKVVEAFFEENSEAEKLQNKLMEWDNKVEGSWLKPFWDNMYLSHRGPVSTEINFNVLLDNKEYKDRYTVAELAGKAAYLTTELYHLIIDEEVEPETIKGTPLDMSQYKNFFKSVRIPKLEKDEYSVGAFDKKNNHVVVLHKKNVYKVNVSDAEGNRYTSKEIGAAIESIFSSEDSEGENIGIFTTAERDKAASIYEHLMVSKVNADNLQTIADSIIVISIDEESADSKETVKNLLVNGNNRYYDKGIEIVINKNGEVGFNIEHTGIDGTTSFAVFNFVNEGLSKDVSEAEQAADHPHVQKLAWEISEEMKDTLANLQKENEEAIKDFYLDLRIFDDFGSDQIKKLKISPDAFFHMALQLAQYRTFATMRSTYEPVAVRFFKDGRTECARSSSTEKWNMVKAFEDGENKETLYTLMQEAGAAHSSRLKECQKGHGVERHMYGLQQMYSLYGEELGMKELPSIFTDKGYQTLRYDFISTSGMANKNIKYCSFGPVVKDGFGMFYVILNDKITINMSSKSNDADNATKLTDNIVAALKELRDIAESNLSLKVE